MSEPRDDEDVLRQGIARVEASIAEFRTDITKLRSYGHRNRILITIVCVLVIATAFVAKSAHDASDAAHRNRQIAVAACQAGNDTREQNRQLWLYVVSLVTAANTHPTPAQAQAIGQFKDKINATFAQRDCDAANPYITPPSH